MGFRFRKSFSLGKLVRINVSKSGIGASIGVKGFRIGVGPTGRVRQTVSLPGTGLSWVKESSGRPRAQLSCPRCGQRVGKNDKFCRHCGNPL